MKIEEAQIGVYVKTLVSWPGVPVNTEGLIVEDYGTGVMVAWDLPNRPLPDLPPAEIGAMYAINPKCPQRDGFDKVREFHFLEVVE